MPTALTTGCITDIMVGKDIDKPVVQILGHKRIAGNDTERYRLLISDGQNLYSFAMLATQLNELQNNGSLCDYTIIRIDRYITSMVNRNEKGEKRVLIILELTVLDPGTEVGAKIGNPQTSTESSAAAAPKPAATGISNGSAYQNKAPGRPAPSNNNNTMNQSTIGNETLTHPINSLSPYQNKWVIKARVTSKSSIRTWSNAKGEGKLFSMDLMDETGEIRVTAFKDQCDKYYEMIQVDKVYYISKCQMKPANKQYSSLKNDYEMTMTNDTIVQECLDDAESIPEVKYDFVQISTIANLEPNSMVDILGVCRDASEAMQFKAKSSGRDLVKRELTLVDQSNASVQLTLWGDDAEKFQQYEQPVVLIKGARVTEFGGGKSLGLIGGSVMKLNPDLEAAHAVRGWFQNGGGESVVTSVSTRTGIGSSYVTEWNTFREAKDKNLGNGDKPDYFQCKALVHNIRTGNAVYKACPQADCNKKVVDQENGQYRCEKCNADFPNFKYRLLVNMLIGDWTSNRWITCFTELSEQMLGKTSQEIGESLEYQKEEGEAIFSALSFKNFIFKLRTKVEFYGDSPRNKTTAVSATPINYKEYNAYLIKNLQELTGVGKN